MFLVTSIWGNALHISPMRIFTTEEAAWNYWDTLDERPPLRRIYQLFPDRPPKLLKPKST